MFELSAALVSAVKQDLSVEALIDLEDAVFSARREAEEFRARSVVDIYGKNGRRDYGDAE
jgi:uncharacterized membrane protein